MTVFQFKDFLLEIVSVARMAGEVIMQVYATDFESRRKSDNSPVTEADTRAEAVITPVLQKLLPNVPVVAEEAVSIGNIPTVGEGPFWLVDPLDGTKEFLNRNGEFTVNIALIDKREPVLGVVFAPARGMLYTGVRGGGAFRQQGGEEALPIHVRAEPEEGLTIVASRRHGDPAQMEAFLGGRKVKETRGAGSSLKFCLVAAGEADLYPRFGPTCEWDVAAGHAVLTAAGGRVTLEDGITPFTYAKRADFLNPHFIAWGGVRM